MDIQTATKDFEKWVISRRSAFVCRYIKKR
jgi:hypothetical protein